MQRSKRKRVVQPVKLLNRVTAWYCQSLREAKEAQESLGFWGIGSELWARFQIGFCNGTLAEIAPVDSEIYQELQATGVLDKAGNEVLAGCVTVPRFNQDGDCMGICGWQVGDPEGKLGFIPGITEELDVETAKDLVERLLREAQVIVPISVETNLMEYLKTDSGFVLELGGVRYEAKGIAKENLKLRVSLKATLK